MDSRVLHNIKQKKRKKRRRLLAIFIPIFVLMISAIGYGSYLVTKAANVAADSEEGLLRGDQSEKRIAKIDPKEDNFSVLIMGVDDSAVRESKSGGVTRADSLILATFNKKEKSVKMVSIPRDTYTYIPAEKKMDKITHSHVYGGVNGTIDAVEELFDVPVDYYVKLNFKAFIDIVEALDGIKVDVPVTFSEQDSNDTPGAIHLKKGPQQLDGEEALALARTRKIDNDIERGKRQQLVLRAILDKAVSVGSITKYGNLMEALGNNIKTNMKFGEMLSLYDYASSGLNIESLKIEGEDTYIRNVYYYKLKESSKDNITETLKNHLEITSSVVAKKDEKSIKD